MGSQQYCLRWNNYQSNLQSVFGKLLNKESFVDVTIACEGLNIKAHKMILSACSPFFEDLFSENPCKHPIVIMKDMKFEDLKSIVEFMYKGEVNVSQEKLTALLKTAEALKIKGLTDMIGDQSTEAEFEQENGFSQPFNQLNFIPGSVPSMPQDDKVSSKKNKRKYNVDTKRNNQPVSPEIIEDDQVSPKNSKKNVSSIDQASEILPDDCNKVVGSESIKLERNSERTHLVDPSSFMQQSLTENQEYNSREDFDQQKQTDADEDMNDSNSMITSCSDSDGHKMIKQEKVDQYYEENVTHILPQPKQEILDTAVTIVPVANQTSVSHSASDNMNFTQSEDQYSPIRDSEPMVSIGQQSTNVDNYSNISGISQSETLSQSGTGAMILSSNNESMDIVPGPSNEQTNPGRSQSTGPRFHASVIANILFNVSGTVCPLCTRNFSSKMSLVRHVRCIHTDLDSIKKHECYLCNKSYVRKDKLHDHLASAHQITSNKQQKPL